MFRRYITLPDGTRVEVTSFTDIMGDQKSGPACTPCEGTGEIIEYPPDEDERMVCCPTCGGTGEATTI